MRKNFLGYLLTISLSILLISGCAKDQVKPDEGIAEGKTAAGETTPSSQTATQQSAVQNAAQDQLAAEKAARDAAALKAAQDAAARKAELDRLAALKQQEEQAPAQSATTDASLQSINFDFDSYVLTQKARDILYNNADYMLKKYRGKVKLEGHCDERGSDEYNLALGENRAKSARNYLLTLGVPSEQVSIISYGKERPLDDGHTEEAWAKNRRVEFVIVK